MSVKMLNHFLNPIGFLVLTVCSKQNLNKAHALRLVDVSLRLLSPDFPHLSLCCLSLQLTCWRNKIICTVDFPIIWILLIVPPCDISQSIFLLFIFLQVGHWMEIGLHPWLLFGKTCSRMSKEYGKGFICSAGDPGLIPGLGRSTREGIGCPLQYSWASVVAQLLKNLPAMKETWVPFLGWEDLLEKGTATHSNILAWRIPWTVYPWGHKELDMTEWLSLTIHGWTYASTRGCMIPNYLSFCDGNNHSWSLIRFINSLGGPWLLFWSNYKLILSYIVAQSCLTLCDPRVCL